MLLYNSQQFKKGSKLLQKTRLQHILIFNFDFEDYTKVIQDVYDILLCNSYF